ncbi:MAG TPA: site-2 protease family protein [Verrucomicrobiales bacterium]|nr:site-2 protease family protein [Verrucomicrobiales bacterium]
MKWSFRLVTIAGTELRVHVTFLLLLLWVVISFSAGGKPDLALGALVFICALFLCVILHEFGHVFAARRYGIRTPDITLLPIGGVARLERMPRKPEQELVVALAGPLVNVAIALILFLILRVVPNLDLTFQLTSPRGLAVSLMAVNIWLVLFNLIPAFPMDGGRVFRALLATKLGYARATDIAATVGQGIALVGGVFAFTHSHLILLLVAVFIFIAAGQEASFTRYRESTRGLPASAAMVTRFRSLERSSTLQDAILLLLSGFQHDFPVVDGEGHVIGILTRTDLISALSEHGKTHPVSAVMREAPPPVEAHTCLSDALDQLSAAQVGTIPVIDDATGRLVGILTSENTGELLMVRSALSRQGDTALPPGSSESCTPGKA